jgi:hypothetical protein
MMPATHEIRIMCKLITSSDSDVDFTFWESVRDSISVCRSCCGGDGTLVYITRLCKIKCLRIKYTYILSLVAWIFVFFQCWVLSGIKFLDRPINLPGVIYFVCVCLCVCVCVFVRACVRYWMCVIMLVIRSKNDSVNL